MDKITLFRLNEDHIQISMELYFNEEHQLIFDGYDIGKTVKNSFGDSDYEYGYTIEPAEVNKLYRIFGLIDDERGKLLQVLKDHFKGNKAYSLFGEFMDKNNINYVSSSWT